MTNQFSTEQNWVVELGLGGREADGLDVEWALASPDFRLNAGGSPCFPFRGAGLGSDILPRASLHCVLESV